MVPLQGRWMHVHDIGSHASSAGRSALGPGLLLLVMRAAGSGRAEAIRVCLTATELIKRC